MSLSAERTLVRILHKVRGRTNATFKRFHPVNPDLGIYLDYNEVVSFSPASTRRLRGMKNVLIDQTLGNTDPVRNLFGHAQKISGDLEHLVLKTVREATHGGINASRIAELDLLTGYEAIANLELTRKDRLQLDGARQHFPVIPVISGLLQIIGQSMARVALVLPTDKTENILASDRNGNTIKRGVTDTFLAGIGGLLLGPLEKTNREV